MRPTIQIINASATPSSDKERLPFDVSDPDDGIRAKFLEALRFDDLSHHPLSAVSYGSSSTDGSGGLFSKANVQIRAAPQIARSKYPNGKEDPNAVSQGGWFSSIDVGNEGLLTEGWIEKHTCNSDAVDASHDLSTACFDTSSALPSVVLVVVTANEDRSGVKIGDEASKIVEQARGAMVNKRPTIVHIAVLVKSYKSTAGGIVRGGGGSAERGEKILQQHRDASLQEKVCTECRLPTANVSVLREADLDKDEWEERVVSSPYAAGVGAGGNSGAGGSEKKIMSPNLRNLASAILRSSASYYALLAEHAERKLTLWRNRYHTTNASFEVNTLVCTLRCGRYAFKSGVFRELEANTGFPSGGSIGSSRNYEESYRWVMELHRRVHQWKSNSSSSPVTPGAASAPNEFNSPRVTESPGGGIGVELSLPPVAEVPPPYGTPGLTSKRGSFSSENVSFYSSLYQQSRAVAGLLNTKLLQCQNTMKDLESTWRRHRVAFMGNYDSDAIYGPKWHRVQYYYEQMKQFADVSEALWRKDATLDPRSLDSSYFSAAAPWGIYAELAGTVLRLGMEVKKTLEREGWKDPEDGTGTKKRFVGSMASGGGVGSWQYCFEQEAKRKHRELALECALHALAILKENDSICRSINDNDTPEYSSTNVKSSTPNAAVRLHYLAGKLFLSQNEPTNALAHLQIAAEKTKDWPSLHLSIQRALLHCQKRCSSAQGERDSFIKLLLDPSSCNMLTTDAQKSTTVTSDTEVIWRDDESQITKPPLDFAVTFLDSTHATCGDTVLACVSIRSCLSIPVYLQSIQLDTTAGCFEISNLHRHVSKDTMKSWVNNEVTQSPETSDVVNVCSGIQLNANGLVYFFTQMKLPPTLVETALGRTAADLSKFHPKNGKLCNMGFTVAAGNLCQSRWLDNTNKISLDGKPVAVLDLAKKDISYFGGVPLVCHGLTLKMKPSSNSSASLVNVRIDRTHHLSPLGRRDVLQYLMEECNYMSHSWSRPAFHPWYLGPRCLRVLGSRPHMEVTNLTDSATGGVCIEGTVNRTVFKLVAGSRYDCKDITMRLRCSSRREKADGVAVETESEDVESDNRSVFVQRSLDTSAKMSTADGICLPMGWEPRQDLISDESHDVSSTVAPALEAGKCLMLPLDVFRPLDVLPYNLSETSHVSTLYELILTFREVRTDVAKDADSTTGNQVMVIQRGNIKWMKPFCGDFVVIEGNQKAFPCGVQHESNSSNASTTSRNKTEIISADGESIRMRFILKTNGLGGNVAAGVNHVINETECDPKQKYLYSLDNSDPFLAKAKHGSKLCTSYCVTTQRNSLSSSEHVTMPLGVIVVSWTPNGFSLSDESFSKSMMPDEYGMAHGPLSLPDVAPMILYGPSCSVLNAPFTAKLLKSPSPRVGRPFRMIYKVVNKTAKSQTLVYSLNDSSGEDSASEQLLVDGKIRGVVTVAAFEEKSFPFTLVSMNAGRIPCPCFQVSSTRHQTWVINESAAGAKYLYVMP